MDRKPDFDLERRMLGRDFRNTEVRALDRVLDTFAAASPGGQHKDIDGRAPVCADMHLSQEGLQLIQRFEGCARRLPDGRFAAYPDPGSGGAPWTIGWGATGPGIAQDTVWTQAQCDARLEADVARFAAEVVAALHGAPTSQAQFDALVSFHYNTGAIGRATLTRLHRAGRHREAAEEFAKWVHAAGRVMPGLVRRRQAEAALYRR